MKRPIVIVLIICVLFVACLLVRTLCYVDLSDYQSATLVYKSDGAEVLCEIDRQDVDELKSILCGFKFKDSPSCGFDTDVSIEFSIGADKTIMFCPACDGCPNVRIGDSDYYIKISEENRARFDEIVKKYGMIFPCV